MPQLPSLNKKGKGQAALEFLMTYGWAALVITVALALIWQYGLFSVEPGRGQTGFWGVKVNDFNYLNNKTLVLQLANNIDNSVNITSIAVEVGQNSYSAWAGNREIESGGKSKFYLSPVKKFETGSYFTSVVIINYEDSRVNATLQNTGELWGEVETS